MKTIEEIALDCARGFMGWEGTWEELDEHSQSGCIFAARGIIASAHSLSDHIDREVLKSLVKENTNSV